MDCDFLIVGAGIAGASAGYALGTRGRVVILERESQPGYHSTGRSAALYTGTYGNFVMRTLAKASRTLLDAPPEGFADHPLMTPRATMLIGRADQEAALEAALEEGRAIVPEVHLLPADAAREYCPALDPDYIAGAVLDPTSMDMDVHAIHHGFLRGVRAAGGRIVTDAEVVGLQRTGEGWTVETRAGTWRAPVVINAAGAWADTLAELAGVAPIGLVPKRRTAMTFDPPPEQPIEGWAAVIDVDEQFYFKPDAGKLLGSPADETPVPPQDVQPEELDIALAVDRIETAARFSVGRIDHRWAGLRSFVDDRSIVIGEAAGAPGFVWLAAQGGYGIMTSPAAGRIAAAAALGEPFPTDVEDLGVSAADVGPGRLATS